MAYPKLDTIIKYQNDKIISRYHRDFPKAAMQPTEALKELMKFIWLCFKHSYDKEKDPTNVSLNFSCIVHPEMVDIDNMWHTFLLFTRDYYDFCMLYLNGIFFHHEPIISLNDDWPEHYEQELTLYLTYIYDNLGQKTVLKWFPIND
ncbi:hypothetical protein ACNVED_14895 (plasmid) [Legionella sp. D16C41]|uniref:hypothetical protein n=1 Tax=Legionella sp. D16C41 TaxID=3402688 RepID=UPI003AF917DA